MAGNFDLVWTLIDYPEKDLAHYWAHSEEVRKDIEATTKKDGNYLRACVRTYDMSGSKALWDFATSPLWVSSSASVNNRSMRRLISDMSKVDLKVTEFLKSFWPYASCAYADDGIGFQAHSHLRDIISAIPSRHSGFEFQTAHSADSSAKSSPCKPCARFTDTELALLYDLLALLESSDDFKKGIFNGVRLEIVLFSKIDICDSCSLHLFQALICRLFQMDHTKVDIWAACFVRGDARSLYLNKEETLESAYKFWNSGWRPVPKKWIVKKLQIVSTMATELGATATR